MKSIALIWDQWMDYWFGDNRGGLALLSGIVAAVTFFSAVAMIPLLIVVMIWFLW